MSRRLLQTIERIFRAIRECNQSTMAFGEAMTQLLEPPKHVAPVEPVDRRWTREEYYRLANEGFFTGQRVELIEGRIIEMPGQGLPHTQAVELVENYARDAFGKGYRYRVQMPFRAADGSDPEPDLAVVAG